MYLSDDNMICKSSFRQVTYFFENEVDASLQPLFRIYLQTVHLLYERLKLLRSQLVQDSTNPPIELLKFNSFGKNVQTIEYRIQGMTLMKGRSSFQSSSKVHTRHMKDHCWP